MNSKFKIATYIFTFTFFVLAVFAFDIPYNMRVSFDSSHVFAQTEEVEMTDDELDEAEDTFEDFELKSESLALENYQVLRIKPPYIHVSNGINMYKIKYDASTYIFSKSNPEGVKLKPMDIVNVYYRERDKKYYYAEIIQLNFRPDRKVRTVWQRRYNIDDYAFADPTYPKGQLLSKIIINLATQNVYAFDNNNKLVGYSRCVTGKSGFGTVRGNFKIWNKESGRYLTGDDYHLWVYYWMPYDGGRGLHDATWRWTFDVNHWVYGSHGCVNMPLKMARFLYQHTKIGTPVIVK